MSLRRTLAGCVSAIALLHAGAAMAANVEISANDIGGERSGD